MTISGGKGGANAFYFAERGAANQDNIWDFSSSDTVRIERPPSLVSMATTMV